MRHDDTTLTNPERDICETGKKGARPALTTYQSPSNEILIGYASERSFAAWRADATNGLTCVSLTAAPAEIDAVADAFWDDDHGLAALQSDASLMEWIDYRIDNATVGHAFRLAAAKYL